MQETKLSAPTLVFCAAAPLDARFLAQWETYLFPLQQAKQITIWSERHLMAGAPRDQQIHEHLDQAQVIVFLLSPDFFASDECMALIERALAGKARVIPLLLRPSAWQQSPLAPLTYLPSNGLPVTSWDDPDKAFHACYEELLLIINQSQSTPSVEKEPSPVRPKSARALALQNQNRERMLRRLRRTYSDLMSQSLQGIAWLELGLAEKPDAVQNATTLLLRMSNRTEQRLPPGTPILEVYDEAGHELLILGEPGAGKSTLLLDLAQQLVRRAEQDQTHPLPVILPISSWAVKRPPLQDWIAEQLAEIYDVPRALSRQWVQEGRILLLLDGLDEMEEAARPACIAAINTYHRDHLAILVVCSRTAEYEAAAERQRLALQDAVVVQPLTHEDVDAYLVRAGKPLAALRSTLKKNAALYDLATTPLMLNILLLTYQGTSVRSLSNKEPLLLQQVWDDYVQRMAERKGDSKRYPLKQTRQWLGWLARQMRKHNQTVFYLEHLQPDWLASGQRQAYAWLAVRLPAIVIGVLTNILVQFFFQVPTPGNDIPLSSLLQYGILGGLLGGLWHSSVPEKGSQGEHRHSRGKRLVGRLAISICVGLIYGLIFGYSFHGIFSYSVGVGLGSLLLQYVLTAPFSPSQPHGNSPTRLWKRAFRFFQSIQGPHALLVAITIWLSFALITVLEIVLTNRLSITLSVGLPYALGRELSTGLSYGISYGLISLALTAQMGDIHLTERIRWTWRNLIRGLFNARHLLIAVLLACISMIFVVLSETLAGGLSNWLIYGSTDGLNIGLRFGLSNGLGIGLSVALIYWCLIGLYKGIAQERIEDQDRRVANQGIHRSLRNSVMMGIIGGTMIGIIGILSFGLSSAVSNSLDRGLTSGLSSGVNYGLEFGLGYGLSFGASVGVRLGISGALLICIITGGLAVWRHYVIRFLLWCSHTFPKQAQFLDDTRARFLLRRVGGGYSFTHRLLLDHFTKAETDAPSSPAGYIRSNFYQHKTTSLFIIPFLSLSDSDLACTSASPHPYGKQPTQIIR
jgi:NACHT domain/TIR domain